MNTPNGAGGRYRKPSNRVGSERIWWCLGGFGGGLAALLGLLLSLPVLREFVHPLGVLSTTGLAFIFLLVWLFLWALIEAMRTRA